MALPNTLYTASIKGHNGKDYTLSIMSDHRTAASTDLSNILADGVTIAWEGGDADDPMYPIVSSTLELNFMADSNLILQDVRDMSVQSPFETVIKMEEDGGSWVWWGHLLPEEVSYEITDGLTEVGLTFVDGLSLLKDIDFKVDAANDFHVNSNEVDGGLYQPCRTALGHVYGILNKITWVREHHAAAVTSTPMLIETPVLSHTGIDAVQDGGDPDTRDKGGILPTLGINPTIFADEKNNNKRRKETRVVQEQTFANCYDVLADILSTLGYKICWNGYNWHCYSVLGHGEDLPSYRYTKGRLDSSTTGRIGALYNPISSPNTSTEDIHQYYELVDGASLSFRPGNGRLTAIHEKAGQRNLIQNKPHYNASGEMIPPIFHYYDVEYVDDVATYVRSSSDTDTPLQNSKWKMTDETFEFDQDDTLSIRFKARMSYPKFSNDTNKCIRNIPLLAIKLKAGTQSHSADPYYLHGPVAKHPNFVNYDNNTGNAPDKVQYVLDLDDAGFLSDIDWALGSTLTTPAASSLSDGIVYIPLHWQGEAYETDVAYLDADQNPTGQIAYGTALVEKKMVGDSDDRFEYKRNAVINEVDINLEIPGFPTGLRGYELEIGMAVMDGTVSTNATLYDSLFDTGVNAIDYLLTSGLTTPSVEYFGMQGLAVDHMTVSLGGSSDANAVYHLGENKEANDLTLIDTRVATTPIAGAGGSRLNLHNDWFIESGEVWSYSGQWYNLIDGWSATADYYDNLRVLVEEFGQRFKNGIISVETDLSASDYSQSWDILTPDMRLFSDKMMSGDTTLIADNITWNSTTGMSLSGLVADRTRGTLTEAIQGGKDLTGDFTNGSTVGYNGSDKPFSNVSEALDGKQDTITGTGVVSVNNDVVSVGNITKGDVTDLQTDLDAKQDNLTGSEDDIVSFDASGNVTVISAASGKDVWDTAASDAATNKADIVTLNSDVSTNTSNISTNTSAIAGKQDALTGTGVVSVNGGVVSVGDITKGDVTDLQTDLDSKIDNPLPGASGADFGRVLVLDGAGNWTTTAAGKPTTWDGAAAQATTNAGDIATNTSDITTLTSTKADVTYVDTEVATKQDAITGTGIVRVTSDVVSVDTAIDQSEVTSLTTDLAAKVAKTDNISELNDVASTLTKGTPTNAQVLQWKNTGTIPSPNWEFIDASIDLNDIANVSVSDTPPYGSVLLFDKYDAISNPSGTDTWQRADYYLPFGTGSAGQVLTYPASGNELTWEDQTGSGGSATVNNAADSTTYDVVMATGNSLFDTQGTGTFEFSTGSSGAVTTATVSNTSNSARLALYQHPTTGIAGLLYNDSASEGRYMLMAQNNDVFLTNRAVSGTIGMRVSGSEGGSTGEWTPLSIDGGTGGWTLNAQAAATGVSASEDTVMTIKHPAVGGNADIVKIDTSYDGTYSVGLAQKTGASRSWTSFEDTAGGGTTGQWKLVGSNQDNITLRTDNTGGKVQLVAPSGVLIESTIDGGGYTLPATDGTSNQVLTTNGTGTVTWSTPKGGGNPWFNFDEVCYNTVSTTEDFYFWLPGSSTTGLSSTTGTELSTLTTAGMWNRYKKLSHRLPSGTYDLDFSIDLSISSSSTGNTHASDMAGDNTQYYVYKMKRSGSNGDVTFGTAIASGTITQDATDTAVGTQVDFSVSGETFDGEERIFVVLKGVASMTATRYALWTYDIQAEKTA